jgi:hypothetical protein
MKKLIGAFLILFVACWALAGGRANQLTYTVLKANAVVTGTDSSGTQLDVGSYEGPIAVILDVAAAGSGATLAFKVKHATSSGGTYNDVSGGGFTTVANAAAQQIIYLNKAALRRFIKLDIVATGSPSAAVSASVVGFKKYQP